MLLPLRCLGLRIVCSLSHCAVQSCMLAAEHACCLCRAVRPGVHVVTGGLGGLGLRAAALLVSCSASEVVSSSRSGRADNIGATAPWYLTLTQSSNLIMKASDVSDATDVRLLLGGRPCIQVLHAAGTHPSYSLDQALSQPFALDCMWQAHSKTGCYVLGQ